jgi:hypothetical protein
LVPCSAANRVPGLRFAVDMQVSGLSGAQNRQKP